MEPNSGTMKIGLKHLEGWLRNSFIPVRNFGHNGSCLVFPKVVLDRISLPRAVQIHNADIPENQPGIEQIKRKNK
jgi:hypothetical protein